MSTRVSTRETMSALADGELDSAQAVDEALALWAADPDARQAWSAFHTAADLLRSEDLAAHVADDEAFLAALRGRLEAEPNAASACAVAGLVTPQEVPAVPAAPAVTPLSAALPRRARWRPPVWMGSLAAAAGVGAVGVVLWVTQLQAPSGSEVASTQNGPAGPGIRVAAVPRVQSGSSGSLGSPVSLGSLGSLGQQGSRPVPAEPSAGPVPGVPIGGSLGRGLAGSQTVSVETAPAGSGAARPRGGATQSGTLEDYLRSHHGTALAPAPVKLEAEGWAMSGLPAGYELQGAVRRLAGPGAPAATAAPGVAGGGPAQQLQAVYSDGTRRVSVFIEPLPAGPPREPAAVRAGSTVVLAGPHPDGAWVTLAGDVPLETLQAFASALQRRR